jgi:hypothetical protein
MEVAKNGIQHRLKLGGFVDFALVAVKRLN